MEARVRTEVVEVKWLLSAKGSLDRSSSSLHRQRLGAAHVVAAHVFVPELEDVVGGGDRGEVERRLVRQEEAAVGEILVAGVEEGEEAGAREETVPHPVAQNEVHLVKKEKCRAKTLGL